MFNSEVNINKFHVHGAFFWNQYKNIYQMLKPHLSGDMALQQHAVGYVTSEIII